MVSYFIIRKRKSPCANIHFPKSSEAFHNVRGSPAVRWHNTQSDASCLQPEWIQARGEGADTPYAEDVLCFLTVTDWFSFTFRFCSWLAQTANQIEKLYGRLNFWLTLFPKPYQAHTVVRRGLPCWPVRFWHTPSGFCHVWLTRGHRSICKTLSSKEIFRPIYW